MNELDDMAQKYLTDKKVGRPGRDHGYTRYYEQYFKPMRYEPIVVLEIGVKHGESLRLWEEYFPNAMIYGIDIREYSKKCETDRIKVFLGDQGNGKFLDKVIEEMAGPPAIVIDDGSHWPIHQVFSLTHLFPALAPGGMYAIEDLESSYGSSRHRRFHLRHEESAIEFLKKLVDDLNYQFHQQEFSVFSHYLEAIHLYPNMSIVLKRKSEDTVIRTHDVILRLIVENGIKTVAHLGCVNNRLCRNIMAPYGVRKDVDEYWAISEWGTEESYKNILDTKKWAFNLNIVRVPSLLKADSYFWLKKRFDLIFLELIPEYELVKEIIQKWKPFVSPGGFLAGYGYGKINWEGVTKAVDEELGEVEVHPMFTWIKRF